MDKLRLNNYRCLEDTGSIELRPITILLGANSTGKSSFIKFFPLLNQSIGTTINGLFLWDGPYVDFKNFNNTVKDGKGEIIVTYQIAELPIIKSYNSTNEKLFDVVVKMVLTRKDEYYDYLSLLSISYEKVNINLEFSINGNCVKIDVNGIESSIFNKESIEVEYGTSLLPILRFSFKGKSLTIRGSSSPSALIALNKANGEKITDFIPFFEFESDKKIKFNRDQIYEKLKKEHNLNEEEIEKLTNIYLYSITGKILLSVNNYFTEMSKEFSYVLPLRSIMNRYYRFQNRDVDQIDPDGDNLAMFLNSLPKAKMEEFNNWLFSIFSFKLFLQKSEGHLEIMIEEENKNLRNLVDVGFGYTQILPIITIIWKSIYGKKKNVRSRYTPITIAIEQPELHLHPRFQAHFVQMLSAVMEYCHKNKIKIRIIIETHSEIIVNKLGQLIENPDSGLKPEDVNIVLFGAKQEGMSSYIHSTEFSNDGFLKEWPFGFFSEDIF